LSKNGHEKSKESSKLKIVNFKKENRDWKTCLSKVCYLKTDGECEKSTQTRWNYVHIIWLSYTDTGKHMTIDS